MQSQKGRIQPLTIGLSITVVVLVIVTGLLAYNYSSAEGKLSSLKDYGQAYCSYVKSAVEQVVEDTQNASESLQAQIQADNSIIASLNVYKPTGYEGMVTTLDGQITQNSAIIAEFGSYTSLSPPPIANFCP